MKKFHLPGVIVFSALKNAFTKPATVAYPKGEAIIDTEYRGRLSYDPTNCVSCGLCMKDCPTGAITIKNLGTKEDRDMHAYLNVGHCIFCCQCCDSCAKKCLSFSNNVMLSGFDRDSLMIEL